MHELSIEDHKTLLPSRLVFPIISILAILVALVSVIVFQTAPEYQTFVLLSIVGVVIFGAFVLLFNRINRVLLLISLLLPVEMIPGLGEYYKDFDLTTPLLVIAILYVGLIALAMPLRIRRTPIDLPILIFVLAQIIIIALSPWAIETLIRYIKYNKVFVFYYFFVNYLTNRKDIFTAVRLYVVSAVLVSLYGVFAFSLFAATGQQLWGLGFSWGYLPRIYGTLRDQNIFAAYMITPFMLLISYYLLSNRGFIKAITAAAIGVVFLAILFTWSRSGFLGLGTAALVYLFLNRQHANRIISRIIPVGLVVAIFISIAANTTGYSPILLVERIMGSAYGTNQSDHLHYYMAQLGREVFMEHPLGIGRSNIFRYLGTASPDTQAYFMGTRGIDVIGEIDGIKQAWPLHSTWLEILVSEGVIGLAAFIFIVGRTIRFGILTLRRSSDISLRLMLISFVAGFMGMLASAIFYTFDWMYFLWFVISMIMVIAISIRHNQYGVRQQ